MITLRNWRKIMLSEFGRLVRKYRIDLHMKLGEMAKGINVTPAYLSAVENNKKKLTADLVEKVVTFLRLDELQASEMRDSAAKSRTEHVISTESQKGIASDAVAMFARSIESSTLSEEQAQEILKILNK